MADVSEALSNEERPIRLGVSSCLLGNEVRFDGGHKRDRFVTDLLGKFVEWVPVCPEVEVGMDVRMAFRIKSIDRSRGFVRYFWKAVPARRTSTETQAA